MLTSMLLGPPADSLTIEDSSDAVHLRQSRGLSHLSFRHGFKVSYYGVAFTPYG
jgi:hypothetical protein